MLVQAYVKEILAQPSQKFDIKEVPGIPGQIKVAQGHATNWRDSVIPILDRIVAGVLDFSNTWANFSDPVEADAKAGKWLDVAAAIRIMKNKVQLQVSQCASAVTTLDDFFNNLESDIRNFNASYDQLCPAIGADKQQIAGLDKKIVFPLSPFV